MYGVNIYALGVPHTIIVDDWIPFVRVGHNSYQTLSARFPDSKSVWPLILEKALAKYHGNYYHLEGGSPLRAVQTLTGAPGKFFMHNKLTVD